MRHSSRTHHALRLLGPRIAAVCGLFVCLAACGPLPTESSIDVEEPFPVDPPLPEYRVVLVVTDEDGTGVDEAEADIAGAGAAALRTPARAADGRIEIAELREPTAVIVRAPGFLPEPVLLSRDASAAPIPVRLWRDAGPGGERRIVVHFGGDVMLGRRYIAPVAGDTHVVSRGDGGASAAATVETISDVFRAADVRSINLETVIGSHSAADAYPKKRFLLQSPPEVVAMLEALSVDFVTLGNNHVRDWLEPGVESTLDALAGAAIPSVGGGLDPVSAREPLVLDIAGYRLGLLSYTSVNGSFVNDSLPDGDDPLPTGLPRSEEWQYERRAFGFESPDVSIDEEIRRIGEAWQLFEGYEATLSTDAAAELWTGLESVYPELQDWVARRGHGGANPLDLGTLPDDIDELRGRGAEFVVVQLHSGFQFQAVKSEFVEAASHAAIDAGADLVVCHHPHVLQGFEWYRGRLVAHSLGNFVFDQDFLSTFSSAILRVVLQETELIEARVLPVVIDRYRPRPLVGVAAGTIVAMLHERSVREAVSDRLGGAVRTVLRSRDADSRPAHLVLDPTGSARIEQDASAATTEIVSLGPGEVAFLAPPRLTRSRAPGGALLGGLEFGRDLFYAWGTFEDLSADAESMGGHHWSLGEAHKRVEVFPVGESLRCLHLRRRASNRDTTFARARARVTFSRHGLYEVEGGVAIPVDGEPSYSIVFRARLDGAGAPLVRLDLYHFDDSNPTEDPTSELLRRVEAPVAVTADGAWHDIVLDLPDDVFEPVDSFAVNATLFYFGLAPPAEGESVLRIDDARFVEWREPDSLPDGLYAIDAVRASGGVTVTRTLERSGG